MDLISEQLGPEAKVKVVIEKGKLGLAVELDTKGIDGKVALFVDSEYFIDELAKAIPGKLDDAILAVLKSALKAL